MTPSPLLWRALIKKALTARVLARTQRHRSRELERGARKPGRTPSLQAYCHALKKSSPRAGARGLEPSQSQFAAILCRQRPRRQPNSKNRKKNRNRLSGFKKALLQNPREMIRGQIFSGMIRIRARKSELQAESRSYRPKVGDTAQNPNRIAQKRAPNGV